MGNKKSLGKRLGEKPGKKMMGKAWEKEDDRFLGGTLWEKCGKKKMGKA